MRRKELFSWSLPLSLVAINFGTEFSPSFDGLFGDAEQVWKWIHCNGMDTAYDRVMG